jgi:large conductance mechanosensitive channel
MRRTIDSPLKLRKTYSGPIAFVGRLVEVLLHVSAKAALAAPTEGADDMFKEFRDFAVKGNMIDLAIGVIIGAAFGAIVSSIVDDIFMPLIGLIIGGVDFSNLFVVLSNPNNIPVASVAAAKEAGVSTLNVGLFINAVVKFTIIAFVLFMVVKAINSLKREAAKEPVSETPAPSKEEVLLTEIRDALRANPR